MCVEKVILYKKATIINIFCKFYSKSFLFQKNITCLFYKDLEGKFYHLKKIVFLGKILGPKTIGLNMALYTVASVKKLSKKCETFF